MLKYVLILFFFFSCAHDTEIIPEYRIVAKVNSDVLLGEEISYISDIKTGNQNNNDIKRQYARQWIQRSILSQEAEQLGYRLTKAEKFSLRNLKKEYLIRKFIFSRLEKSKITELDIQNYYDAHRNEFKRSENEYHLIYLFVPKRSKIIQSEVKAQKDLLKVIRKFHLTKTVNNELLNGDLGYVKEKALATKLVKRLKKARIKKIYGPSRIKNGYYYFELKGIKRAGSFFDLEEAKTDIKERLISVKTTIVKKKMLQELKSKYVIKNKF